MRFRYYITDLFSDSIKGTDKEEVAMNFSQSSDHFVVDTTAGEWLIEAGDRISVEDIESEKSNDPT